MRRIVLLALLVPSFFASSAEARLFWQTFGAVVPSENGCERNWNQDYFVPRYASSCKYELYSPCETSRSVSPACLWNHPFNSGYCGIYGPGHYRRQERALRVHCGCDRERVRIGRCNCVSSGCGCSCLNDGVAAGCLSSFRCVAPLSNLEAPGFEILGSIPAEDDIQLPSTASTTSDTQQEQQTGMPQLLNAIGLPGATTPSPTPAVN